MAIMMLAAALVALEAASFLRAASAGEPPPPPPFAALLSFCTGDKFAEMGRLASLNHNAYAARHGYDFVKVGRVDSIISRVDTTHGSSD